MGTGNAFFTGFKTGDGTAVSTAFLIVRIQRQQWFKVTGWMTRHLQSSPIYNIIQSVPATLTLSLDTFKNKLTNLYRFTDCR